MFFFALLIFSCCLWFLPWWCLNVTAFLLGGINKVPQARSLHVACAGAVSMAALAFIKDGQSSGMISLRMSALFHLPGSWLIFLLMAILGGISSWLSYRGGFVLRRWT